MAALMFISGIGVTFTLGYYLKADKLETLNRQALDLSSYLNSRYQSLKQDQKSSLQEQARLLKDLAQSLEDALSLRPSHEYSELKLDTESIYASYLQQDSDFGQSSPAAPAPGATPDSNRADSQAQGITRGSTTAGTQASVQGLASSASLAQAAREAAASNSTPAVVLAQATSSDQAAPSDQAPAPEQASSPALITASNQASTRGSSAAPAAGSDSALAQTQAAAAPATNHASGLATNLETNPETSSEANSDPAALAVASPEGKENSLRPGSGPQTGPNAQNGPHPQTGAQTDLEAQTALTSPLQDEAPASAGIPSRSPAADRDALYHQQARLGTPAPHYDPYALPSPASLAGFLEKRDPSLKVLIYRALDDSFYPRGFEDADPYALKIEGRALTDLTASAAAPAVFEVEIAGVPCLGVISPLFDCNLAVALIKPLDALGGALAPAATPGIGNLEAELERLDLAVVLLNDNSPVFANDKAAALLLNPPGPWDGLLGLISSGKASSETAAQAGLGAAGRSTAAATGAEVGSEDSLAADGSAYSGREGNDKAQGSSRGQGASGAFSSLRPGLEAAWQGEGPRRLFWAEAPLQGSCKVVVLSSKASWHMILAAALLLSVLVPLVCLIFSVCLIFNFTCVFAKEFEGFYKALGLLDPNEAKGELADLKGLKERAGLEEYELDEFNRSVKRLYESAVKQELLEQKKLADSFAAGEHRGKGFVLSLSTLPLQQTLSAFKESVFVDPRFKCTGGLTACLTLKIDDTSVAFVLAQSLWGMEHKDLGIGDRRQVASYFKAQHILTCALFHAREALLRKKSCHETLCLVNQALCLNIKNPVGVMMHTGILNERTGNYLTASAGFRAPLIVAAGSEVRELDPVPSPPLGISEGTMYSSRKGILVMGDRLLWLSDRLQQDLDDLKLGLDRKGLYDLVAGSGKTGSAELLDNLAAALAGGHEHGIGAATGQVPAEALSTGQAPASIPGMISSPAPDNADRAGALGAGSLSAGEDTARNELLKISGGDLELSGPAALGATEDNREAQTRDQGSSPSQSLGEGHEPGEELSGPQEEAAAASQQDPGDNPGTLQSDDSLEGGEAYFVGGKAAGNAFLKASDAVQSTVSGPAGSNEPLPGAGAEQKPQGSSEPLQARQEAFGQTGAPAEAVEAAPGAADAGSGRSGELAGVSGTGGQELLVQEAQGADAAAVVAASAPAQNGRAQQAAPAALFPKDYAMFCLTQKAIRF